MHLPLNAPPSYAPPRLGAILGLGLAYAGKQREEVQELLVPLITDTDVAIEVSGFAALALGLVFTSTCKEDIVMAILQALMCRSEAELQTPFAKQLCLGLGMLFMAKQDMVEATVEVGGVGMVGVDYGVGGDSGGGWGFG